MVRLLWDVHIIYPLLLNHQEFLKCDCFSAPHIFAFKGEKTQSNRVRWSEHKGVSHSVNGEGKRAGRGSDCFSTLSAFLPCKVISGYLLDEGMRGSVLGPS
jgi:hypothetical protein